MPARNRPTPQDAATARRILLDGLTRVRALPAGPALERHMPLVLR